ncbi:MAG: hypothetical protein GY749_10295 [Desulfobacteraceae bacterium]|nr:hypothetical protein [Desulfobacteraceae bacterium]
MKLQGGWSAAQPTVLTEKMGCAALPTVNDMVNTFRIGKYLFSLNQIYPDKVWVARQS